MQLRPQAGTYGDHFLLRESPLDAMFRVLGALPSSFCILTGLCLIDRSSKTPRPAHALQIRFEIASQTFSSLKVEQVKVTVENYKPFKGVRGKSVGNVEWRW